MSSLINIDGAGEFDRISYDAVADVLYMSRSDAGAAHHTYATPEGHAVRYDESGNIIGVTLVNARWLMERDGTLQITAPKRFSVDADDLGRVLARA
jgi:YD repeat-containing protein